MSRFDIISILGKGFFGKTYYAYDKILKINVALKIIPLSDSNVSLQSIDEIEALKSLSKYPSCNKHIVCYYDGYLESDNNMNYLYIVTEYIDGITLDTFMKINQYIPDKYLLDIIYKLIEGLVTIHSKNYCHGDIKPENIMITKNGDIKYIDFGLACTLDCDIECHDNCNRRTIEPVLYKSPEYYSLKYRNIDLAKSNDVWALGVIIYQLLNNNNYPFDLSVDIQTLKNNILTAPKYRSNRTDILDKFISDILINDYKNRPDIKSIYSKFITIINDYSSYDNKDDADLMFDEESSDVIQSSDSSQSYYEDIPIFKYYM